jgi:hypothetical protein
MQPSGHGLQWKWEPRRKQHRLTLSQVKMSKDYGYINTHRPFRY